MSQKLYILVKEDLSPAQKVVQACHAVEAWANRFGGYVGIAQNIVHTKVVCAVSDWQYDIMKRKMNQRSIRYAEFKEPDMSMRPTALAVLHDGNLFSDLPLLGEEKVDNRAGIFRDISK